LTVSTLEAAAAAKEFRRWLLWLGGALLGACVFTALALAGLGAWLLAPAIVIGPGVGGVLLVWLALSSDTNGASAPAAADTMEEVAAARAA
jgi:threonine/homoserine/homoserine lactone efflux protein